MDELPGKKFGPYLIVEKIAEGGMAVVYKGYQESLNRYVAIKVLRKELVSDQKFVTRFRREALAVAKLSHPNILPIYDANVADGWHYIAMEYVEGGSLKDLLARGPLPMERAISLCTQLADALDYAHRQGVVHRDVKPANVLLTYGGRPMLADFGIAQALHESSHLTHTGTSIGTPAYMAPEQAGGQPTDGRTDIYALGIVLYEMLTGQPPFTAAIPVATLYQQVNEPPPRLRQANPNIPRWLEAAVSTALAKRPEDRFQQSGEFAEVLRERRTPVPQGRNRLQPKAQTSATQIIGRRGPSPSVAPGGAAQAKRSTRRRRTKSAVPILLAAVLIVFLALSAGGAYLFLSNPPEGTPTGSVQTPMTDTPLPSPPKATVVVVVTVPAATKTPTPTSSVAPDTPQPTASRSTATPSPTTRPTREAPFASPTPTPSPAPTKAKPTTPAPPVPTGQPGVITDFEAFGTWRRGDEPNGTFTQSGEQSHQGSYSGKLAYDFGTVDNDYVVFEQRHLIAGEPEQVTAWVYGDGSGHFLNIWIKDSGGQVWQVPLGRILHTGWQLMIGTLDVNQTWPWAHISGSDNGKVDYPVSFQAIVLDDNPDPFVGTGTIYIDDLRASTGTAPGPGQGGGVGPSPTPAVRAGTPAPPGSKLPGRIAFTVYNAGIRNYTLYTVKPDGSELHAVADYVHQPDFSPNGRRIVVDGTGGGKDDLWSFSVDGSDWRQMTTHTDDHFPNWSPNSLVVGFSSTRQGNGAYWLYIQDSPVNSDITKYVIGDYPVWVATWEVVYAGCDYGWGTGAHCGLWRVSNGRRPIQLTDNPLDIPTDGTTDEILFLRPGGQVTSDGGNWDIYRMALNGGNAVRLTDSPGNDGPAAFSPDGQTIAFLSVRSGAWALHTMDRQGNNVKKVVDLPQGGNYGAAPEPWTKERISWGSVPVQSTPVPTAVDSHLLPAPQIVFPIPDDTVSSSKPTTIRWTWSGKLAANQGFEVRVWHTSSKTPMGVAPPTTQTELQLHFGLTEAYLQHGEGTYFLDVVVVQASPYKVLSKNAPIRVKTDPNK